MKIAKVILDIQNNRFSSAYKYAICEDLPENSALKAMQKSLSEQVEFKDKGKYDIKVGSSVIVPFGKQFKIAFVIDIFEEDDYSALSTGKLKPILFAVTNQIFTKDNVEFARYISQTYLSSFASALRLFIPSGSSAKLTHKDNVWKASVHHYRKIDDDFINKYISNSLKETRDWKNFVLTQGQSKALNLITKSIEEKNNDVYVLDGVTGSGKTEVYLRSINKVLEAGKNAIVLVPEISLTPQTVSRFRQRFGDKIAVLHSKITAAERNNQFEKILSGKANVVIGARSALFCPLKNIGLIVIDEEHENSYKQDKNPRYLSRNCAEFLAKQQNSVLILGSATPSLDAIYQCSVKDNWNHVMLNQRTNNKPLPKIDVVDMGLEFKSGHKSLFSRKLEQEICSELNAGHKVVLFHNRRGFANYMFCRGCGYTPKCPNCSTTLTYHQRMILDGKPKQMLMCHHCGHLEHVPITCPECQSPYIAKYGAGTQSVEEQLESLLSENEIDGVRIIRMDADTTKKAFGHQECLEEFSQPGPAVLLGTQMIAKGLDFDEVTLVGVILIDTNLTLPDFRSSERTFNLILQVAGRAGRADLAGKVIVQTYTPDAESISMAANYQKDQFVDLELAKRKLMHYPPYYRLANIVISGGNEDEVKIAANNIHDVIEKYIFDNKLEDYEVTDVSTCVLEKIRNKFRYHVYVKSYSFNDFSKMLEKALIGLKIKSSMKLNIDIDPISTL